MFRYLSAFITIVTVAFSATGEEVVSYAERLGWGPEDKVVIFHVDDVGMSRSSNLGTIASMEEGVATSCSIMMPCAWVSEYFHYLRDHPDTDTGLHLTLTSEWEEYRWGPLAGKTQVPGLVDNEGCMWRDVKGAVLNASPDEIEIEIRAQIDRARTMGFEITHLDSHMGTVFEPKFIDRYIKVGLEEQIPIMFMGGHVQFLRASNENLPVDMLRAVAERLWEGGLPVLDDLHNDSYGWKREEKTEKFIEVVRTMKPGLLQVIIHASDPTDIFPTITDSGESRKGDLEGMIDPRLRAAIEEEGVILTTWRELKERRDAVKSETE